MKIDREINGDLAVLSLRGEFDSFVVSSFLEEMESLVANGITSVVLDMRMVKFIMSTAIGAVVKSRKMLRDIGGDLVIAQPSGFVRDVLESLGLTRVIKVFDENNLAVESLGRHVSAELPAGNSVMLHFASPERQKALGRPAVGRILDLDENGMKLQVAQAAAYFPDGAEVKAKFRLPLFKKAYYFEIPSTIAGAVANEDGAAVRIRFEQIEDEDRKSIQQFVSDMDFLRNEVKKAGD
ncbi:MAG: anti-sigma factor antagonist [Planctomycetes bacterium]|nr:anti-sigma factor antagonist [Planctomycetota bacterium]